MIDISRHYFPRSETTSRDRKISSYHTKGYACLMGEKHKTQYRNKAIKVFERTGMTKHHGLDQVGVVRCNETLKGTSSIVFMEK